MYGFGFLLLHRCGCAERTCMLVHCDSLSRRCCFCLHHHTKSASAHARKEGLLCRDTIEGEQEHTLLELLYAVAGIRAMSSAALHPAARSAPYRTSYDL